jgi:hypothetical protein
MPEMQSTTQSAAAMPVMMDSFASGFDDSDYALGCECADPSLQIERWGQEAGAADNG